MKVIMEPAFVRDKELAELVQAATPLVEDFLERPAKRMTTTWGLRSDERGETWVHLTISDPMAGEQTASTEFSADELESPKDAREKVYRLWRDLSDAAMDRSLEYLKANAPTE